jgi:2,3-bisphosphoglycerate-dependent phosphoglycerate mutase
VGAAEQGFCALACSSLRRAGSTAVLVADRTGLEPRIEPDLRELDFGTAEGRSLAELREAQPAVAEAFLADPVANPWPGGEDPAAAARRGAACVLRLARSAPPGGRVLAVTHRTLIRLVLCELLGLPLGRYRDAFRRLEPLSATTLEVTDSRAGLVGYNMVVVR